MLTKKSQLNVGVIGYSPLFHMGRGHLKEMAQNPGFLPKAACDINGDGNFIGQVGDAVYILNFNFLGGLPPPGPFPNCGLGTSDKDKALGCENPRGCPP